MIWRSAIATGEGPLITMLPSASARLRDPLPESRWESSFLDANSNSIDTCDSPRSFTGVIEETDFKKFFALQISTDEKERVMMVPSGMASHSDFTC